MNISRILKIIEKESRVLLRNKRILFGLIAPFILLPILIYGYTYFSDKTEATTAETASLIYYDNANSESLPTALTWLFEKNADHIDMIETSDIPEGLDQAIADRKVDLVLEYDKAEDGHAFILKYDFGRSSGTRASERVMEVLDVFAEAERDNLLNEEGVDIKKSTSVELVASDMASKEEVTGRNLAGILPLVLVLYTMMMIINFSTELTTAEKESETLETLLSVPLTRVEMVMGKLFSCILFSVASMAFILIGVYLMMPLFVDMNALGFTLSPKLFISIFLTLIPLLFIGSGLSIAVGMFASSYKESGAYVTPLVFLFMVPAYVATTPGIELNTMFSMIPILNATLLIKEALINRFDFGFFSIAFFVNLLFAVMSLAFMFKVFTTEKILFGSGKELSFRLQRKKIKQRETIEAADVFMGLAVIIVLYINLSVILPNYLTFEGVFYISQYGVFMLAPLLLIWYLKAALKTSIGINAPDSRGILPGISFWIAALSLSMLYQVLISGFVTEVPTLVELQDQLQGWSTWKQFLFIALTPAICEEILFRGFALRPLEKAFGAKWAIILTAIAFAIVHLDFVRLVPTFALGLAFGYTAVKTRSIFPSMVLHLLNNSFALFMPESFMLQSWQLAIIFATSLFLGWTFNKGKRIITE